jgi:hypothetical protein
MNRAEMAEIFDRHLHNVTAHYEWTEEYPQGQGPLKTYIIEAHDLDGATPSPVGAQSALGDLERRFDFKMEATDDPTLAILAKNETRFFLDTLNPRFWVVHTTANIVPAQKYLEELVHRSWNLDFAWLPSQILSYLRKGRQFLGFNVDFDQALFLSPAAQQEALDRSVIFKTRYRGNRGDRLFDFLSSQSFNPMLCLSAVKYSVSDSASGAYIQNELNASGRVMATGNSISLHLGAVNHLVNLYAEMIQTLESELGLAFVRGDNGDELQGYPLTLEFSEPVLDFQGFAKEILSCREETRLWGVVTHEEPEFVRAEVVDLHSASRLRLELTPTHLVIYLFKGSCGNSVARIFRVVQEHLDPTVYFKLERATVFDQCKEA